MRTVGWTHVRFSGTGSPHCGALPTPRCIDTGLLPPKSFLLPNIHGHPSQCDGGQLVPEAASGNDRGVEGYTLQLPQPSREGKSNVSSVLSPRLSNPNRTEPQLHTSGILPCGKPLAPGSLPHFSCWSILGNSQINHSHSKPGLGACL